LEGPSAQEPAWVADFRQSHSPDRYKNAKWHALQAAANAPPLRVLLDDPGRPQEFMALYNASPFAQEAQFALLESLLVEEKLGQGAAFDFVGMALSPMAALRHQ